MNSEAHVSDKALLEFVCGESADMATIARHLNDCAECRSRRKELDMLLAAAEMPVPEPDSGFEERVWSRVSARLAEPAPVAWREAWTRWLPRPVWQVAAVAAMLAVAFVAGRTSTGRTSISPIPQPQRATVDSVRGRVLTAAVREHFERSQVVLVELNNADLSRQDLAIERAMAADLVESSRLLRMTAVAENRRALALTLEELERVLLELSHGTSRPGAGVESLRRRIDEQDLLFKLRVLTARLEAERGLEVRSD